MGMVENDLPILYLPCHQMLVVFSFLLCKVLLVFLCYQTVWFCFAVFTSIVIHMCWSQLVTAQGVVIWPMHTSIINEGDLCGKLYKGKPLGLSLCGEKRSRNLLLVENTYGRRARAERGLTKLHWAMFISWLLPWSYTECDAVIPMLAATLLFSSSLKRCVGMRKARMTLL